MAQTTPNQINEYEVGEFGTWKLNNGAYQATWPNGAIGTITVGQWTETSVILYRQDLSGASAGLSAVYQGTISGLNVAGTELVYWPGHAGFPRTNGWSGNFISAPPPQLGQLQGGKPPRPGTACSCNSVDPSKTTSITGGVKAGEPIDIASGNVFYETTDYTTSGQNPLSYTRYYNGRGNFSILASFLATAGSSNWRSNFDRYLLVAQPLSVVLAERGDGLVVAFTLTNGVWKPDSDVDMTLTNSGETWTLTDHDDTVETYSQAIPIANLLNLKATLISVKSRNGYTQTLSYNDAQLASVTDSYNRSFHFIYNSSGAVSTLTTPDNTIIAYGYTAGSGSSENLTSVTFPTSPAQKMTYVYGDSSFPNLLTGIIDENGDTYASWTYDANARALTSSMGGPALQANLTTISYNDSNGGRTVTNPLGATDTYAFTTLQGVPKVTQVSRAATGTTPAMTRTFGYDSNGYMSEQTDWNGNVTSYVNNPHGDPTTINEAVGSAVARTTTILYDPTWVHLPDTITTPGVTAKFTYDGIGEQLTRTLTDTTTTTVPYSTKGQTMTTTNAWSNHLLASIKTPNGNSTSLGYSSSGALTSVTDGLGHVTRITEYSGGGLPETVIDPNGVTTTNAYDARQRITSSSISTSAGTLTANWTYYLNGDVTTALPDGSFLTTLLDTAHRMIGVADNYDNQQDWALDASGDPVTVTLHDPTGTTTFWRNHTFDALGRMLQDESQTTGKAYVHTVDNNGNPLSATDPLTHKTTNVFDALNRLSTSTDANSGVATMTYDAHDRPVSIKDKNGNTTTYVYDGFGDLIEQVSPDSGTTVYHFDGDGNLTSKTDAASVTTNYTYDALDRSLTRTYPADSAENVAYSYDHTGHGFGIGRLTSVTDAAGSLSRTYDERGNVLTEKRTNGSNILTTTYTYDKASRIASITYPSGAKSTYTRDAAGNVIQMPFAAANADLTYSLNGVTHLPFGPINYLDYQQGDSATFTYDQDYRMTAQVSNPYSGTSFISRAYGYDAANNLTSVTDNLTSANSQTLGYDVLNRLNSASSSGTYGTLAWAYDKNNNLTSNKVGSTVYTDTYTAGTNRISASTWTGNSESIVYTATGNMSSLTQNGSNVFTMTYNKANRLSSVTGGGVPLAISGMTYDYGGKRITKANPGSSPNLYTYDLDGNLIEENDSGTVTDYIYVDGVNVANWEPNEKHLYSINPDRVGVPLMSRDEYGLTNWAAYTTPYGGMTLTVGTGQFTGPITQNLRLPGQYFDHEYSAHHNGFRDYFPGMGRYFEADPIGLGGGLNSYAYANSNPGIYTDPLGTETLSEVLNSNEYWAQIYDMAGEAFGAGSAAAFVIAPELAAPLAVTSAFFGIESLLMGNQPPNPTEVGLDSAVDLLFCEKPIDFAYQLFKYAKTLSPDQPSLGQAPPLPPLPDSGGTCPAEVDGRLHLCIYKIH